nr:hypothetical protein [Tanacetum cinerariifolium]
GSGCRGRAARQPSCRPPGGAHGRIRAPRGWPSRSSSPQTGLLRGPGGGSSARRPGRLLSQTGR